MTKAEESVGEKNSTQDTGGIAYILHWFPKASETFIFAEVTGLWKRGVAVKVFSLYDKCRTDLSPEMLDALEGVYSMGTRAAWRLPIDFIHWLVRKPSLTLALPWKILVRRWRDVEMIGENVWAFFCAFHLARKMEEGGIRHVHAPWANGPATAAWVVSILTGIPFSFSARAGDIHPQDGALAEKMDAARFVRANNKANVDYLAGFAGGRRDKIHQVYNALPIHVAGLAAVRMTPPVRVLAAGRFVRIKGFHILLHAVARLRDEGVPVHLTLAGDGWLRPFLRREIQRLRIEELVSLPGFVTHKKMSGYYETADLFVMSSVVVDNGDRDGLPNVILEAMAYRLPVVATDVCGIREVVIDGRTGRLVPARDPAALAAAMKEAICDRERALALADAGRALVLAEFDPERNVGKMAELLTGATSAR